MPTKVLKLQNANKSTIYRVKPHWKNNSFEITILLEDSTAWYADITAEQLSTLAEKLSQSLKLYYENIKEYLCKPDEDIFVDIKSKSNDSSEFIIKRKIGSRTIIFFSVELKKVDFQQNVFNLIDELEKDSLDLLDVIEKSKQKEISLENDKKLYQDKLAELIEVKANWEQEMYSNFIIVLNEKKKRIKFLTDMLSSKNIDPNQVKVAKRADIQQATPPSSPHKQKKLETISDSDSNSAYETDEDEPMDEVVNVAPKPSTSRFTLDMDDDDDLPVMSLPKFSKKSEKEAPKIIKENLKATPTILTEEKHNSPTQEPYLSTQEMIDRM